MCWSRLALKPTRHLEPQTAAVQVEVDRGCSKETARKTPGFLDSRPYIEQDIAMCKDGDQTNHQNQASKPVARWETYIWKISLPIEHQCTTSELETWFPDRKWPWKMASAGRLADARHLCGRLIQLSPARPDYCYHMMFLKAVNPYCKPGSEYSMVCGWSWGNM